MCDRLISCVYLYNMRVCIFAYTLVELIRTLSTKGKKCLDYRHFWLTIKVNDKKHIFLDFPIEWAQSLCLNIA
jgi:hypothetical protein